jgi:hypothetical protein
MDDQLLEVVKKAIAAREESPAEWFLGDYGPLFL